MLKILSDFIYIQNNEVTCSFPVLSLQNKYLHMIYMSLSTLETNI
jgi:hypothetical protein